MKIYILVQTYEEMYNQKNFRHHFDTILLVDFNDKDNGADKDEPIFYNTDLNSEFAKIVYLFLEKIVLKVEIRVGD